MGLYADTLLGSGQPVPAMELLDQGLATMHAASRTYFFQSELHRLRARGLLQLGGSDAVDEARSALDESLVVAERQGSSALALRTLIDRLELELGENDQAATPWRDRLGLVLTVYDDQAPTPDADRARELLDA
ncbi:MAG: hypothetical protein GY773_20005 [Actinomycetia bacterium]|nr:hypothetical protein [Actinomycetes bacterium]